MIEHFLGGINEKNNGNRNQVLGKLIVMSFISVKYSVGESATKHQNLKRKKLIEYRKYITETC
jgi:hypothetical protein